MARIHPTDNKLSCKDHTSSSVWTVWKKSSMAFQGTDGFSVYDSEGKLAFRVDNYSRKRKELFLMDGAGKTLLALQPKFLSIYNQWNGFKCTEDVTKTIYKSQIFSMKRRSVLRNNDDEVVVFMGSANRTTPDFHIEGCFWRRSCKIRSKTGEIVAQISRKKVNKSSIVLSDDVFRLEISPSTDEELVMACVVIMDRICRKPYAPLNCSRTIGNSVL